MCMGHLMLAAAPGVLQKSPCRWHTPDAQAPNRRQPTNPLLPLLQAVSNSLWAYAKLGFNPGVQVLDVAAHRVMLSLHQYNSQELANMLFSFATLEHHPGVQLLETAALQIATRLDQFSPQVAVTCWHSFACRSRHLLVAAALKSAS